MTPSIVGARAVIRLRTEIGRAIDLSDGRAVQVIPIGGVWYVRVVHPYGSTEAPAVDRDDAAWLATAYVLGAIDAGGVW